MDLWYTESFLKLTHGHMDKVNSDGYFLMLVMYKNRYGSIELLGGAFMAKKEEEYRSTTLGKGLPKRNPR
jgi:hypothetical protein